MTEDVCKAAKRLYPALPAEDVKDAEAIHVHCNDNRSHVILPFDCNLNQIVHEAYHFCWRLMHHIGADHENEIMAYHMGYTVDKIVEWVAKVEETCQNDKLPLDKPAEV